MQTLIFLLNYFYVTFVLLWEPIHKTIIPFDAKGRTIVFLSIFVFLLNLITNRKFQRLFLSKPIIIWGIWIVYSGINLSVNGYHGDLPFLFYVILKIFTPFSIMLIVALEFFYNPKKTMYLLLVIFAIYGVFTLTLIDNYTGISGERNTGELGNLGPLNTMFIIFYSGLLFVHKWLNQRSLIILIVFAFFVILSIATRKAFGVGVIMFTFIILSQINLSPKKLVLVTGLSLITISGANFTMNYTALGKRLATLEETGAKINTTNNQTLNLLGDRAFFYIEGWKIFLKNPINGIGLNNFQIKSKANYRIHSEYMVQITEGGIIGSLIFLFFNVWILFSLFQSWKTHIYERDTILVLAGGFIAILFVNITAWTYAFPQYFACFGIIIGFVNKMKNENCHSWFRGRIV